MKATRLRFSCRANGKAQSRETDPDPPTLTVPEFVLMTCQKTPGRSGLLHYAASERSVSQTGGKQRGTSHPVAVNVSVF